MADVQKAVLVVLRQEDATLSGAITDRSDDLGGVTRFGIAKKWHPTLAKTTFYTTMRAADALQVAVLTLTDEYAAPMMIAKIEDDLTAQKLLSFGVNAGMGNAICAMQQAVNNVWPGSEIKVAVDGAMGPETIAAINRLMRESLLNSFRLCMIAYYRSLCRVSPSQTANLVGWIDRALQ